MIRRTFLASLLACVFASGLILEIGAQGTPPGHVRKIVVFRPAFTQAPAQEAVVKAAGATVIKPLRLINAMAVSLPAPAVEALARRAEVVRVDEDLEIRATDAATAAAPPVALAKGKPAPPPPAQTTPWGVARVGAPDAWAYSTGTWVKVAIVDTGIQLDHGDLAANIAGGTNLVNPRKSANDDNGHGTHVAGIAAAVDNNIGVVGVAPAVRLYAVKVLGAGGSGTLSDVIDGLTWCIDNQMQVLNMSLGSPTDNQSFHDAITKVYQAGIVQVAAAGNNSGGPVDYPGRYPEVIAVSASDSGDRFASFSSAGPEVALIAPGASIYSTYKGSKYRTLSGTSMASPHVAGIAALRLQLHSTETPDTVKSVLQSNTMLLPGLTANQQGAGLPLAFLVVTAP